jgi:hypothetical protein
MTEPGTVKNPSRVPTVLTALDSPSTVPGVGVQIIRQEIAVMADEMGTIKKDGTYKNSAGDQFFFRSGHKLPRAQANDLKLVEEGLPLTDVEKAMAERNAEAAQAAAEESEEQTRAAAAPAETKAKGSAPENKSA